eukprot:scaffold85740_cov66-Phaeocystis_antarctica.AAC.24
MGRRYRRSCSQAILRAVPTRRGRGQAATPRTAQERAGPNIIVGKLLHRSLRESVLAPRPRPQLRPRPHPTPTFTLAR